MALDEPRPASGMFGAGNLARLRVPSAERTARKPRQSLLPGFAWFASIAPTIASRAWSGRRRPGGRVPTRYPRVAHPIGSSIGTHPATRSSNHSAHRSTWRGQKYPRALASRKPPSSSWNQPGSEPLCNVIHGARPAARMSRSTCRSWATRSVSMMPSRISRRAHSIVTRTALVPSVASNAASSA